MPVGPRTPSTGPPGPSERSEAVGTAKEVLGLQDFIGFKALSRTPLGFWIWLWISILIWLDLDLIWIWIGFGFGVGFYLTLGPHSSHSSPGEVPRRLQVGIRRSSLGKATRVTNSYKSYKVHDRA